MLHITHLTFIVLQWTKAYKELQTSGIGRIGLVLQYAGTVYSYVARIIMYIVHNMNFVIIDLTREFTNIFQK